MIVSIYPFVFVLVFILADIVTGLIKAAVNREVSSTVMRHGLLRKASEILLVVVSMACAVSVQYIDGLPEQLSFVYTGLSLYVIVMELISIIENVCDINPDLKLTKILSLFGVDKDKDDQDD